MIKKFLRLLCVLLACTGAECMEQPPQKPALQQHNPASLQGLPADIKRHLIPFVVSGTLKDMKRELYTFAALNKQFHAFVNDPQNMIAILNGLPRICTGISMVERLQGKLNSLPVMKHLLIVDWLHEAKI